MTTPDADVVIVGYGPVGATLAVLLAQAGHRVTIVERWDRPYPLPRAVHFDHEVGRIFQSCGIAAGLRAISEPADIYEWRNADGLTLLRLGNTGPAASGWPGSSMFHQPSLEALLAERVEALDGIEVRRGVEVTAVEQTDSAVVVHGRHASGEAVAVSGRYVVGCDGANSFVRSAVDAPVTDLGFFYDWLIVDVVLHDGRVFDPINVQVCDPARPTTAVSGGPGRRRWEFMRLPDEDKAALDDRQRAWDLLAPWDVTPANATIERHAVYTFNARWAEQWRVGRVLLAGDAAHQMPPFAGQGMCSGIRDAASLAWRLDLVLRDLSLDALLDTYAEERMPEVRGAIELSMALGSIICVPDPNEAEHRDAAMSAGVGAEPSPVPETPPIERGVLHPTAPHAGKPFVQGLVAEGSLFDDADGAGWRLVTIDDAGSLDLDAEDRDRFAAIGGRISWVADRDRAGTYATWFAGHGATWALQRPDFRLYGTADSASGAAALLGALLDTINISTDQGAQPCASPM